MNIILMGLPAQVKVLKQKKIGCYIRNLHISTGDMFRAAMQQETELGLKS